MRSVERALVRLVSAYFEGALCPVLGAGASQDSGGPSWNRLVLELARSLNLERRVSGRWDPIQVFELLSHRADGSPDRLAPSLRNILYRSILPLDDCRALQHLAVTAISTALIAPERAFHAVTYNMDCLLEEAIAALGHRAVAVVVEEQRGSLEAAWPPSKVAPRVRSLQASRVDLPVEVRVFHPHGIVLPLNRWLEEPAKRVGRYGIRKGAGPKDSPSQLGVVLGRYDYNELFGSLNDPRNVRQLAAFQDLSCLFYGLSFRDPNVDRLLQVTWKIDRSTERRGSKEFRHVALIKAPSTISPDRVDGWSLDDELDLRDEDRLAHRRILRVGRASYAQHKRFAVELNRRIALRAGHAFPGITDPRLVALSQVD